jgi:hypothetical protein
MAQLTDPREGRLIWERPDPLPRSEWGGPSKSPPLTRKPVDILKPTFKDRRREK